MNKGHSAIIHIFGLAESGFAGLNNQIGTLRAPRVWRPEGPAQKTGHVYHKR